MNISPYSDSSTYAESSGSRREGVPRILARKIFALTLIPTVIVTAAAVLLIHVQVGKQIREQGVQQLNTASAVLRDVLHEEGQYLLTQAGIVARDPKFFAMIAHPGIERDESYRRTLEELSADFEQALQGDLFEIIDIDGAVLYRSGSPTAYLSQITKGPDFEAALSMRPSTGTMALKGKLFHVSTMPVIAGNRLVGILRHGKIMDSDLANRLKGSTNCEVSFLLRGLVVATSHEGTEDGNFITSEIPLPHPFKNDVCSALLERSTTSDSIFLAKLRNRLITIGFFTFVLVFILARWVTVRINGPVQQLVEAAERLESGEGEIPIEIRTGDELEYLGRRFEEMRTALRNRIETLKEVDRMKSTFLALASHELRTPATIISGSVQLISCMDGSSEDLTLLEEVMPALADGAKRLERVLEVITDMSLIDRREADMKRSRINLHELIVSLENGWKKYRDDREHDITLEFADTSLHIDGDPSRVAQVIDILVHNAIRYTPDGGKIDIHVLPAGDNVRIGVLDTGIGIPDDDRDRVFEQFYESKNVMSHSSGEVDFGSSGLGMGLAIARSIMEMHQGRIWYEPREGGGSQFQIEFPVARGPREVRTEMNELVTGSAGV